MSEYLCNNGHFMKSGEYVCPECGGRIGFIDGMSRSELRRMEAMDDRDGDTEEEI